MPLLTYAAAAQRGRLSIHGALDQTVTRFQDDPNAGEKEKNTTKLAQISNGIVARPLLRSLIVFGLNLLLALVGGVIFSYIEQPAELAMRTQRAAVVSRLNATLPPEDWEALITALGHSVRDLQSEAVAVERGELDTLNLDWDLSGATFFVFTVATSIGYGTFAPVTPTGRGFTILYAIISVPMMLFAFTQLVAEILQVVARKMAGKKRDLPAKVFRMMDRNRSGTICKTELLVALQMMGLGDYHSNSTTMAKRKRFDEIFDQMDRNKSGELDLAEFRGMLQKLVPDEDQVLLLVDVVTRSYVAMVAVIVFFTFVLLSSFAFLYLKEDEQWTLLDSLYFSVITFLTIGLGDLAPEPHPYMYMLMWLTCTFFGLGVTTAMVQTLSDPSLSWRATFRGLCHSKLTGALDLHKIKEGVHRSSYRTRMQKELSWEREMAGEKSRVIRKTGYRSNTRRDRLPPRPKKQHSSGAVKPAHGEQGLGPQKPLPPPGATKLMDDAPPLPPRPQLKAPLTTTTANGAETRSSNDDAMCA